MDKIKRHFGGSGLDKEVYDYIRFTIPVGSTILEIGSGDCSTKYLSDFYKMFSIENNPEYIDKYKSKYIFAPLLDGWYDIDYLKNMPKHYDLILIDGPVDETHRVDILKHLDLFKKDIPWVFHDINRLSEKDILPRISSILGKQILTFPEYDFFGVLL